MALDEHEQQELARGLQQELGNRTTELLMRRIDASEVATKADLVAMTADLRAELGAVRHDLQSQIQALDHKVDLQKQELLAEIHRTSRNQLLGMAAVMATFNTGLFAAAALVLR